MAIKRPLASDEALGLSGYTAASADADDVADGADGVGSASTATSASFRASAPLQPSVMLAKPVQSYQALNGKTYENYDEALVHSYEFLIDQQVEAERNIQGELAAAIDLLYNYPYIVNLMAERNKAWLDWDEARKAKEDSNNG